MPGEFTSRFDKEILKSAMAAENQKALAAQKEKAEADRVENDVKEIGKILDRRKDFFTGRFPNASLEKVDFLGFKVLFAAAGDKKAGNFQLKTRLNDSKMAVLVESEHEIAGSKRAYDYISLPTQKVDMDKAKRFIEAKLLDFARMYVG